MGVFNKLLNSQKVVDGAIKGLDNTFFTKEEKAASAKAIIDGHSEFVKSSLAGSTVSSLTRRYIAVAIMVVFLFLVLLAAGVYWWNPDYANFLVKLIRDELANLVLLVAGFYFGSYLISNHLLKGLGQVKEKGKDK